MKAQKNALPTITIKISVDASGKFAYHPGASVQVKRKQGVDWTCDDGNFAVLFKGDSPFPRAAYGAEKRKTSELAFVSETSDSSYAYSAMVVRDGVTYENDPEIVVDNGDKGGGSPAAYKEPSPAKKTAKKAVAKKQATKQAKKR